MAIPELTYEQRRANLDKAMKLRQERAEIRAELKDGTITMSDVLALRDIENEALLGMRVSSLLTAFPNVGLKRMQEVMRKCGISSSRRVRGLGIRQWKKLLAIFGDDAK